MIVCSAPRTGSTLVWQVASRLLPDETVEKFHGPEMLAFMEEHPDSKEPVIIPQRNRVDAYLSLLRTSRFDGEEEDWLAAMRSGDVFTHVESFRYELASIEKVRETYDGEQLILGYDVLWSCRKWLIDKIANFIGGPRPSYDTKRSIFKETSIQANRERQAKLSGFSEYDSESKIHGRHIWNGDRLGFGLAFMLAPDIREKLTNALNS